MAVIEPKYYNFIWIILESWLQRLFFSYFLYNGKVGADIWLIQHQTLNKLVEIKATGETQKHESGVNSNILQNIRLIKLFFQLYGRSN